jgi:hypothetical protein
MKPSNRCIYERVTRGNRLPKGTLPLKSVGEQGYPRGSLLATLVRDTPMSLNATLATYQNNLLSPFDRPSLFFHPFSSLLGIHHRALREI